MGGHSGRQARQLSGFGVQRFYEELPLGPKIMVSHPARVWCPPTDVYECENEFVIKIALSGLPRDSEGKLKDVEVLVEGDSVVVTGERKDQCDTNRCRYFQMEIYYGRFECRIRFGAPFDQAGIQAEYHDGFLEVTVPKAKGASAQAQRIQIQQ